MVIIRNRSINRGMNYIRGNNKDYRAGQAGKNKSVSRTSASRSMQVNKSLTNAQLSSLIHKYEKALKLLKLELKSRTNE